MFGLRRPRYCITFVPRALLTWTVRCFYKRKSRPRDATLRHSTPGRAPHLDPKSLLEGREGPRPPKAAWGLSAGRCALPPGRPRSESGDACSPWGTDVGQRTPHWARQDPWAWRHVLASCHWRALTTAQCDRRQGEPSPGELWSERLDPGFSGRDPESKEDGPPPPPPPPPKGSQTQSWRSLSFF